jgi:hypothetical protein
MRANRADKRRQQAKQAEKNIQRPHSSTKATITQQKNLAKDWQYWLTQASFKEFIIALFLPSLGKKGS